MALNSTDTGHIPAEVLEDAARGLLSPADRAAVDAHCASCVPCHEAMEAELRLARGIRSHGRAGLKQRLGARIAAREARAVPWPRILAAAAVLLVIAGTGLMYRWLTSGTEAPAVTVGTSVHDTLFAKQDLAVMQEQAASAPAPTRTSSASSSSVQKTVAADEEREAYAPRQQEVPAAAPATQGAGAELNAPAGEAASMFAETKSETGELVLWGTVITEDTRSKDKSVYAAEPAARRATNEAMMDRAEGKLAGAARGSQVFTIDQQQVLARYRLDTAASPDAVAARITVRGDTVHVTLMPDPLFPETSIGRAFVRPCPPDSFQVVLPGRRIGFRTPSGILR